MKKQKPALILAVSGILLFSVVFSSCLKKSPQEEVFLQNIKAAGGSENLAKVKNYSFRIGPATYSCSRDGRMKITAGREPVISDVTIVAKTGVRRNSFNEITEVSGLEKSSLQILAQLYGGLFSLKNFKGQLRYDGLKKFGPEELHCLSAERDGLRASFYIDSEEFLLRRVVFSSFDPERGKYEANHDFGPYQEVEGVKIPLSWYISQVGARGIEAELQEVKVNKALEKDFFDKLDVNIGAVTASPGSLSGNVIEFNVFRNNLSILTNWRKKDTEEAGFKTNDRLILLVDGAEQELVFYESAEEIPRSTYEQGGKLMYPDRRRGNSCVINFIAVEYKSIEEKLSALLPIQVRKVQ